MSAYLDRIPRSLDDMLDDLRVEYDNANRLCNELEQEQVEHFDDAARFDRAAASFDHWDNERSRIGHQIEELEEEIGFRNAREDRSDYYGSR